jgi:hypothetical protein
VKTNTKPPSLPTLPVREPVIFTPKPVTITRSDTGSVITILSKLILADYWDIPANKEKLNTMLKSDENSKLLDDIEITPLHVLNYMYLSSADHAVLREAQAVKNNAKITAANVTLAEFYTLMESGEVTIDTIEDKINLEFLKKICNTKEDLQDLQRAVKDSTTDPLAVAKYLTGRLEQLTAKPVAQITSMTQLIDAINKYFSPQEEIREEIREEIKEAPLPPPKDDILPVTPKYVQPLEEGEPIPPPPPKKTMPPPAPPRVTTKAPPAMGLSVKERMKAFQKEPESKPSGRPRKPSI